MLPLVMTSHGALVIVEVPVLHSVGDAVGSAVGGAVGGARSKT